MNENHAPPDISTQFSLRKLFFGLTIAAALFSLAFYVRQAQDEAQSMSSGYSFQQVSVALLTFHDTFGSLPYPVRRTGGGDSIFPSGYDDQAKPLHSWRFAMLPYLVSSSIPAHYDKSWDNPANQGWRFGGHSFGYDSLQPNPPSFETKMFAITGPGTAFGDGEQELPHSLDELDDDTILVVEVRDSGVHWMAPGISTSARCRARSTHRTAGESPAASAPASTSSSPTAPSGGCRTTLPLRSWRSSLRPRARGDTTATRRWASISFPTNGLSA